MLIRLLICSCIVQAVFGQEISHPQVLVPGWEIELVLVEPEIVTPTACAVDPTGRLLVVECHTHFPPDDYTGPKTDRIFALTDSTGDGRFDRKDVFYTGGVATMGLTALADGSVVVVSRAEVTRLADTDDDGTVDQRESLLQLITEAEYPHNGLGGVAVAPDKSLLIGLGENFGEPYELVAADGSKQIGGGEGGSIFRLGVDGTKLERMATGFWNPFGICIDNANRVWTVGNDPDAMPPCRLLHVVDGGDYGFQFRFGRGGRHPLQAWNGELPGTLPFAAGIGEAACAVLPVKDRLWVTSWGDNRIESYQLSPRGSSWSSETQVVVQGGPNFRPVGLTRGPDGSIYFTDWVDRDYSVHRKGRVWRLRPLKPDLGHPVSLPELTSAERRGNRLTADSPLSELIGALNDQDVFVHQRVMATLAKHARLDTVNFTDLTTERERAGVLAAWRWRELSVPGAVTPEIRREWITHAIAADDEAPKLIALRWAAERNEKQLLPLILALHNSPTLSSKLFPAVIATVSYLQQGTARSGVRDPAREELLKSIAADARRSSQIRSMAIRMLPSNASRPSAADLEAWLRDKDEALGNEVVRLMSHRASPADEAALARIAMDEHLPPETRADAIAGLSVDEHGAELNLLSRDKAIPVSREARRVLRTGLDKTPPPSADDMGEWMKLVGQGGNAASGRRVFDRMSCCRCHVHSGRGAMTGPDLTSLQGKTRSQLLESILDPNKEVSPLYVPWQIITTDGKSLLGLKATTAGVPSRLKFQAPDGEEFEVALEHIESQSLAEQSIMPSGLEKTMTVSELRDLLAFLSDT